MISTYIVIALIVCVVLLSHENATLRQGDSLDRLEQITACLVQAQSVQAAVDWASPGRRPSLRN